MRNARVVLVVLLIVALAALRAVHFERSLVPMGAFALFCGARFRSRWLAFAAPIACMVLGDVLLGLMRQNPSFYTFHKLLPFVYGCYALNVLMGIGLKRFWDWLNATHAVDRDSSLPEKKPLPAVVTVLTTRVLPIAATTLAGAVLFYLLTNFADWYFFNTYEKTWGGLMKCYAAAIPFFSRGTLLADVVGAVLFFGGDYLLETRAAEEAESERV